MANGFKNFFGRYRIPVIVVAVLGLVGAGTYLAYLNWPRPTPGGQTIPVSGGGTTTTSGGQAVEGSAGSQMLINLSEGQAQPAAFIPLPVVEGDPLSDEQVQAILVRLPSLVLEPGDQQDFNLPVDPIPPPRPGETVQEAFPPPPAVIQPQPEDAGPLEVLRYAPEGEIPVAPFVSVTFSQPMVPLATLETLAAADVPVRIEPELDGTWRWLGTKTLTFEYDSDRFDRLPKATEYRVTVPAGTTSATGGVLASAVEFSFSTPPPKVIDAYPQDQPQPLEPVFFIQFDQRVDPAAVLETIKVNSGSLRASLKLLDEAEAGRDEQVKNMLKWAQEGRWLAFTVQEPLPQDSPVTVTVGPGTPSAEGPLTSTEPHSFSFHTYAPLKIVEHRCSWGEEVCRPLTPFYIRFNNPLDRSAYKDEMLVIEPELPGASVDVYGDSINIEGASRGRTTYTVLVSGEIQDIFGQKLGQDARLTFNVGPAEPRLFMGDQTFVTLDPSATQPVFNVYSINYNKLEVKVYAVQPSDWPAFQQYMRDYQRTDVPVEVPGRLVEEKSLPVESPADTLVEVGIDLSPYMDGSFGHFIVIVEPPKGILKDDRDRYWQTVHAWVQVTQIGLDAFSDHSEMVVWTTALKDGAPLSGVRVEAFPGGVVATSGPDGTARFDIPTGAAFLVASQGADRALLSRSTYFWDEGVWNSWQPSDNIYWYVYDDRQMYRPGEEVHIKGWLRKVGGGQLGDVALVGNLVDSVSFRLIGPQGNDLGGGTAQVSALGGFDFAFTLPEEVNLGYAQLILDAQGALGSLGNRTYYHGFQIQEFRRPEFEVVARVEDPGPYYAWEPELVAVKASYYAGGSLPNADVTWQVYSSPATYEPPNWPDFTFGTWQPWWWYGPVFYEEVYVEYGGGTVETFTGKTDANGEHFLQLDFDSTDPRPYSVTAEGTVMDVNRQAWTGSTNLLVHPAELYIGLRSERYFVQRGTPLKIDFIVTDLEGNPVFDRPVEVRAARLEWKFNGSNWAEEEVDVQTCKTGSKAEPVSCTFETPVGGSYRITGVVTDSGGRVNQSQFTRWVSGGEQPPARKVEQETVTLIPDKEDYQPGDVAEILVQAPFSAGEGLLTVTRSGILYTERFQLEDGGATLRVPIEDQHIPNLIIQVDLAGSAQRVDDRGELVPDAPQRPAYASGQLILNIPPVQRTLSLQVEPREKELEPGGETTLDLLLQDANGNPVADAELAVVVVDEAVLALSNYQLADPLGVFYSTRPTELMSLYGRASIVLLDPLALAQGGAADVMKVEVMREVEGTATNALGLAPAPAMEEPAMEMDEAQSSAGEPIRVRIDFNPLATFAPEVRTGADGRASVQVKVPDNLTRYRVMVVAVDDTGKQFGQGETNLVARLPLMVRPSAPRFLNFGDQFELPVVLQNQTDEGLEVDVVVQASNLTINGPVGVRVIVPARNRVEVRFPASAELAGTARIQIAAVSGSYADAATVELPVYTPATTEAFATYGVVDEGAVAQPVVNPADVFPQYGGLEINTSSTALQALTDAVLYLVSYPYECSEQMASRILAVAALRDVLTAFEADGLPSPEAMEAAVGRDIERLQGLQNADGGFPYWRRGFDSIPFNSIHVAHALAMAERKGFVVPGEMKRLLDEHLRRIEDYYPSWYNQQTRWVLSSYALYVRNLMGDRDPDKALRILNDATLERLPLDAIGWLWPVLQDVSAAGDELDAVRRYVNNRVVETPGAANFTTQYDDQNYLLLGSDRRTDAILMDALIVDNPDHDLIPKLVNGLLAHAKKGRWNNTQENVFVLLALDRYFNTFETQTPDFVARIWLGDTYAAGHEYQGRTTERHETLIPMSYLAGEGLVPGETQDLVISKEGVGRLYYRLGLRYAPTDLAQDPLDMGFVVQRVYEAVDDPDDVRLDDDGVWHIKAGARVRVRVTMVASNRRYHVALVDPLPAGLEIVNPALAVSGTVPQDPGSQESRYGWWWWWTWYEHQNLRDERAEAFTPLLWDGVYSYTYVARATTPGRFVVPPAKAEEMYSPEVFGRSASAIVIVE